MSWLFDLGFFVDHMFTNNRIKFSDLHFVRHGSLVLARSVVVPGSRRRYQFDLFSHALNLLPTGAKIINDLVDTQLVNNPHTFGGYAQFDETLFFFQPESMIMDIRQEPALGLVVRMRNIISRNRFLPSHLTYSGHV